MLAALTPIIRRGIIDNTQQGVISLCLWCERENEPLQLTLQGNCLQDIAGCRVNFELSHHHHTTPSVSRLLPLYKLVQELRSGQADIFAGDITLAHRALAADGSSQVENRLSIELFTSTHMRILIESAHFAFDISLPEWECSAAAHAAQRLINMSALREHIIANVAAYRGPSLTRVGDTIPPCRWDDILNRAEAYMAIVPSVHEKYALEQDALQTEAFVLDRIELLDKMADAAERGVRFELPERPNGWEVLDFVGSENTERVVEAMSHPLFDTTIELSYIMQHYIISDLERYRSYPEVENMVAQFAGIISLVLGTILLSQDPLPPPGVALARARELTARLEKLKFYHKHLRPKAADKYLSGVCALIAGLKHFVCSLHS